MSATENPLRAAVIRCLRASGQDAGADRMEKCGNWYMAECPECHCEVSPREDFCHVRICPDCAARESKRRFAVALSTIHMLNDRKRGMFRFITLTSRNPYDGGDIGRLEKQLKQAGKAIYKLWRNVLSKAGPNAGALAGIEVAPGGMVHVHVLHFGDYVNFKGVQKTWHRLMGAFWIKIAKVRGNDREALHEALAECTKYLCDPRKAGPKMAAHANKASRRLRCYRTYGTLFELGAREMDAHHLTCPACLYEGPMNRGRSVSWQEADAWLSGLPNVRRTGSRAPPSLQAEVFKGLCFRGNFTLDMPPVLCQI